MLVVLLLFNLQRPWGLFPDVYSTVCLFLQGAGGVRFARVPYNIGSGVMIILQL